MKNIAFLVLLGGLVLSTGCARDNEKPAAQTSASEPAPSPPPDADNTARNDPKSPDGLASADTPLDQGETKPDLEISASIRKSIVKDKSLSTNAHIIKIMTASGKVTLRGPVKSESEKSKIEGYAKTVGGVNGIDNLLEVEKNP